MNQLSSFLLQSENHLPAFLYLTGAIGLMSATSAFFNTASASKQYNNAPQSVTKLMSRTMGLWHATSAAIRLTTATDITNHSLYLLSMFTFVLVLVHVISEIAIFRTANLKMPIISPVIVASIGLSYMYSQYHIRFPA